LRTGASGMSFVPKLLREGLDYRKSDHIFRYRRKHTLELRQMITVDRDFRGLAPGAILRRHLRGFLGNQSSHGRHILAPGFNSGALGGRTRSMFQFVAVLLVVTLLAFPITPCSWLVACARAADHGMAGHSDSSPCMHHDPGMSDCSWSQDHGHGGASRCRCLELKPPAVTPPTQDISPVLAVPVGEAETAGPRSSADSYGLALENYGHSFWDSGGQILFLTNSFRS